MKYIKKFENKDHEIGDYILYRIYYYNNPTDTFAQIYDISKDSFDFFPYKVQYIDKNKLDKDSCNSTNIVRNLTHDEIEEFKTRIAQIQYNL